MHGKATGAVRSHPLQLCRERSYVGNTFLPGESRDQWETRESALIRHSWIQMVARGEDWKGTPNLRGFEMRPPRRGIPLIPDLEYADSRPMMAPIHMASRLKHANATHLRDLAHSLKKNQGNTPKKCIYTIFLPPRCFVWGDPIEVVICLPIQSLNRRRGVLRGRRRASYIGVWGSDSPHKMYMVHQF